MNREDAEVMKAIKSVILFIVYGIAGAFATAIFLYAIYAVFNQVNISTNGVGSKALQESWSAITFITSNPLVDAVGILGLAIVVYYAVSDWLERKRQHRYY